MWHGGDQLWYEEGVWTRVAYLNMTEPGTICPSAAGLRQAGYININHDVCGWPTPSSAGCESTFFSAYYYKSLDSFFKFLGIDSDYIC